MLNLWYPKWFALVFHWFDLIQQSLEVIIAVACSSLVKGGSGESSHPCLFMVEKKGAENSCSGCFTASLGVEIEHGEEKELKLKWTGKRALLWLHIELCVIILSCPWMRSDYRLGKVLSYNRFHLLHIRPAHVGTSSFWFQILFWSEKKEKGASQMKIPPIHFLARFE